MAECGKLDEFMEEFTTFPSSVHEPAGKSDGSKFLFFRWNSV